MILEYLICCFSNVVIEDDLGLHFTLPKVVLSPFLVAEVERDLRTRSTLTPDLVHTFPANFIFNQVRGNWQRRHIWDLIFLTEFFIVSTISKSRNTCCKR